MVDSRGAHRRRGGLLAEAREKRMVAGNWTREQLLVAFALYHRLPCGRFREDDHEVKQFAQAIGRSPVALKMKLWNIASLDPTLSPGRRSLDNTSTSDRAMWNEMQDDWTRFAIECEQALVNIAAASGTCQRRRPTSAWARSAQLKRWPASGKDSFAPPY